MHEARRERLHLVDAREPGVGLPDLEPAVHAARHEVTGEEMPVELQAGNALAIGALALNAVDAAGLYDFVQERLHKTEK